MTEINRFDPFNNRLCRNVRNALSEAFVTALQQADMHPVRRAAGFFLAEALPEPVKAYIDNRLTAYEHVLTDIRQRPSEDPLDIAFRIWDQRLFFETHEYLEPFWMSAEGERKKMFQAVIRAAGTYVHLEQGNLKGAGRIAAKAIHALEGLQGRLSAHADPHVLLEKLSRLDPDPPILSGTAWSAKPDLS